MLTARTWALEGKKMKKIFLFLFVLSNCFLFAKESLSGLFIFEARKIDEINVERGSLEPSFIKDKNYTSCWIFHTENIKGIDSFLYYPYYDNSTCKTFESKIEINNQEIFFKGSFDIPFTHFYTLEYENKIYLIITTSLGKYCDQTARIFDITNPEKIIFYPSEGKFIEKDFGERFVGIYQNKLCFFFSKKRFEWNGQYELAPYYIEGDAFKQLCDKNGKPYFVNYSYKDRFEQELLIEEKNEYKDK